MWEIAPPYDEWLLTEAGFSELRTAVRREQQDRYDMLFKWGALVIGVLGAISGLVAVIAAASK